MAKKRKAVAEARGAPETDAVEQEQEQEDTETYICNDGTTMKGEPVEAGAELELTPTAARNMTDRGVSLTKAAD